LSRKTKYIDPSEFKSKVVPLREMKEPVSIIGVYPIIYPSTAQYLILGKRTTRVFRRTRDGHVNALSVRHNVIKAQVIKMI